MSWRVPSSEPVFSIRPKKQDDWTVVANLWGDVVGGPSMVKTPIGEAMKPLDRLEAAAKAAYDTAKKTHDAEYDLSSPERVHSRPICGRLL